MFFDNTIVYTPEQFFNDQKRKEVEKKYYKDKITNALCFAIPVTGLAVGAITGLYFPSETAVEVACAGIIRIGSNLDYFNEIVVQALNKLYAVTCIGALTMETVMHGSVTREKFTSSLIKYSTLYAGGLFVIYALAEIKKLL